MAQTVIGFFPKTVRFNSALPTHWFPTGDVNDRAVPLTSGQRDSILEKLQAKLETESTNFSTKAFDPTFWRGYNCSISGSVDVLPAPEVMPLRLIKTNNGLRWSKHKTSGEIIVSDYAIGSAVVSYGLGQKVLTSRPYDKRSMYSYQIGLNAASTGGGSSIGWVDIPGFGRVQGFPLEVIIWKNTQLSGLSPFSEGFTTVGLKEALIDFTRFRIDSDIVAAVAADANRGDLDLLTFLAEMPETLRSMYDLLKRLTRIATDLKNKEFRIYNKLKKNVIENRKTRYVMIGTTKVADEIASLRLRYRYEIEPLVYSLQDLANYFLNPIRLYSKHRKREIEALGKFSHSAWQSPSNTGTETLRCNCKRLYELSDDNAQFSRAFNQDIAVTAYELIPGSFILDWAFNFGDRITALGLFTEDVYLEQGFTASIAHDADFKMYGPSQLGKAGDPYVNITLKNYERKVINPREHLCVSPSDGLTDEIRRKLDLLAFGWISFSNRYGAKAPRNR